MNAPLILLVDDDAAIRESLAAELRVAGHDVVTAANGREGDEIAALREPALIVTDLAMPIADGFALIGAIRARSSTPIVVISVRVRDDDKVRALDLGADDYVVKPFSVAELLARVRAQMRRTRPALDQEVLRFPGLEIDIGRRRVMQEGREVRLTPTEFALLQLLARHAGRPLTFDQIIARVWRVTSGITRDAVRVHVGSLRRKLEPDASNPRYLVTEPWVGYRFIAEPL